MVTTKWQLVLGLGAGLAFFGCSNSDSSLPPTSELHQGLNIIDATDPSFGLDAAFVQGKQVVYIQTRVGAPKPDVYRQTWPNDPPNEIDMRVVDASGHTFYVQRGGDTYVDPTWADDIAESLGAKVDFARRDADFKLAKVAATALVAGAPAAFHDNVFSVEHFAEQAAPSEDARMVARAAKISQTQLPKEAGETGYWNFNYGNYSWLETDLYSGDTGCFFWVCVAKHSATRMWDCEWNPESNSCSWVLAQEACNHGRCAYDGGMGYNCYSNGGWFFNATINGETYGDHGGGTSISGGCATPYNWDSGGYDHLCNDDAAYELWQAKNGSAGNNGVWGTGGGSITFQWYGSSTKGNSHFACDCQSFGNCDNDYGRAYCP
jgi:hypothetical protein